MRLLCCIGFWLMTSMSTAQPYVPLLGQTNSWHAVSCFNGCIVDTYGTAGDTTISGLDYKVLDGYHYIQGNFLLREDVQERMVYMKILGGHVLLEEFPLYDFSLEVGDTTHVYNPISPSPEDGGLYVLDSVVSRTLETGDHRFFYLHAVDPFISGSENTIWVEGVGSLSLINSPGAGPSDGEHLGCAFKDGVLIYSNTDSIEGCVQISSIDEELEERRFRVFPNPTVQLLNVEVNGDHEPLVVSLFDLNGKLIRQERLTADQKMARLDLSSLAMAYYTLTIVDEEGKYLSFHKVMKSGGN
jgi:hypothetical protein